MSHCTSILRTRRFPAVRPLPALIGGLVILASAGCSRQLTITQDNYINNAMQIDRSPQDRTGEPLELDIVCVYPSDLSDPRNARLTPTAGLTSEEWFRRRPIPGDQVNLGAPSDRFWLPEEQIFLLTNDRQYYGQRIGAALRGAKLDGTAVTKGGIEFNTWFLHSENSVIYVFGRFTDKQGKVLPVPPAEFHPPGAYNSHLAIRVGVRESGANYGQYIEIDTALCPRKMHDGN
jgi:hypothetical protein